MKRTQRTIEQSLADLWVSLYDETIDIAPEDSFFGLGGTSILAVRLVERIRQEFDVAFKLVLLLDNPTLQAQADCVRDLLHARDSSKTEDL
jgi:acyl carrier protein